jgi:non-ribosomal peptide synthetase component F
MSAAKELFSKSPSAADTEATDFDETLITAFERTARELPSNVAVSSDTWEVSYRDFNTAANRLAHHLISLGGTPGDRMALLMEHDTPAIAAMVGALKAGRIVTALGTSDPLPRLKMLMADAEPSVIVTDPTNVELAGKIAAAGCAVVIFEPQTVTGPREDPPALTRPEDTAILGYTSGATGHPKGVMYTHRQFRRNAAVHTDAMQYTERDRIPLLSTMSAGQGASGVWPALLNGATICPFPIRTKGVTGLADWFVRYRLTVYVSSASIFRTLCKTITDPGLFSRVRAVRLASESVTADDFRLFLRFFPPGSVFVHTLSSSETSNIAWHRWTRDDPVPEGKLPVGSLSRNIHVSLVGEDGKPVLPGEIGEILVRSRYVAGGYWRDPALTATRFSEDLDGRGTRLVQTGDLARFGEADLLEFCGRKDDLAEQRFGGLTLKRIAYPIGEMPWGCQVCIDERNPENCRVDFNANLYEREGMQALVDRYVRLLEIASRQPELTIGRLVALSSDNSLRRAIANYATRRRERIAAG